MSNADYKDVEQIESTLPRPWEEEHTFNDVLYDWMGRAPWLAISGAAHLLAFFVLTSIPWDAFSKEDPPIITASVEAPADEPIEEPEEEEIPEEEEEIEPIEDPILKDAEVSDHNEEDVDQPFESMVGDPDMNSDSPFDSDNSNDVIGIGGGAGGKFGGRLGGRRNLRAAHGKGLDQALKDALEWLKNHQSPDGSWSTADFSSECGKIGNTICGDPGYQTHDIGSTGLALLAFLGEGNTTDSGDYKVQVAMGIKWLRSRQDPDSGLLGEKSSHEFLYNHAIGTLALCEAYYATKSPLLKRTCQRAIDYINRARNPYGAWRYDEPPMGANDTSVSGWMIFAIKAAEDAKLRIDPAAYDGAREWLSQVTDEANGRVGYNEYGNLSSRITGVNDHFPAEKGEAMTAVGLLMRMFMGETDPKESPILKKHGDLMLRTLPEWDPDGFGSDMYYWYYGSYAMYQLGGTHWKKWEAALKKTILENQRKDGDEKGSWDPIGPWGYAGGRIYSTALMALCIEVYFRYGKVAGAR